MKKDILVKNASDVLPKSMMDMVVKGLHYEVVKNQLTCKAEILLGKYRFSYKK